MYISLLNIDHLFIKCNSPRDYWSSIHQMQRCLWLGLVLHQAIRIEYQKEQTTQFYSWSWTTASKLNFCPASNVFSRSSKLCTTLRSLPTFKCSWIFFFSKRFRGNRAKVPTEQKEIEGRGHHIKIIKYTGKTHRVAVDLANLGLPNAKCLTLFQLGCGKTFKWRHVLSALLKTRMG